MWIIEGTKQTLSASKLPRAGKAAVAWEDKVR